MSVLPGCELFLFIGGVKVGHEVSHTLNRQYNSIKKTGRLLDREILMTDKEGVINVSFYTNFLDVTYNTLITAAEEQTLSSFEIKTDQIGSYEFSFNGYITGLTQEATQNNAVRVDLQIVITGQVTLQEVQFFTSLWNTANTSTGSSTGNQIQLPLISTGNYNFIVDWGDGSEDTITAWNQAETLHTYTSSGTKSISIRGIIQGWSFAGTGDRNKIINISNWGSLTITGGNAFFGCENLSLSSVTGVPTLSSSSSLTAAFRGCTNLTTINNLENWDITNCTDLTSCFNSCPNFNSSGLNSWDLSSATNLSSFLFGCSSFNQRLDNWNVSNVTNFATLFADCSVFNQDLSNWDISSALRVDSMFSNAVAFNNSGIAITWTTGGSCTNYNSMFLNALAFNQDCSSWDTSSGQNFSSMFSGCGVFDQDLGAWNLTAATNMSNMLDNSGLSTANYDATLIGWELPTTGTTPTGITLGANGLTYTSAGAGGTARTNLINNSSWSFVGDSGV